MSFRITHKAQFHAFTLIELLAVIAIIAIIAAILFPVFSRSREKARQTTCLSNLKQLGLAFQMYVQDNDEEYPGSGRETDPPGSGWVPNVSFTTTSPCQVQGGVIYPYVRNAPVYICPSDPVGMRTRLSYSMNNRLSLQYIFVVNSTAQIILLIDEQNGMDNGAFNPASDSAATVHFEGTNFAFADGHAKWKEKDQIVYATLPPGRTIPVFPNDFNDFNSQNP